MSALGHLAWCALVAAGLARQETALSQTGENLFIVRWLLLAQKQKRFSRSVAPDIAWLIKEGRTGGPGISLRHKLEMLWRSCSEDIRQQSDLFRLTAATEALRDAGWQNHLMTDREWSGQEAMVYASVPTMYMCKSLLHEGFNDDGKLMVPTEVRVVGNTVDFTAVMDEHGFIISHGRAKSACTVIFLSA